MKNNSRNVKLFEMAAFAIKSVCSLKCTRQANNPTTAIPNSLLVLVNNRLGTA